MQTGQLAGIEMQAPIPFGARERNEYPNFCTSQNDPRCVHEPLSQRWVLRFLVMNRSVA